MLATIDKYEVMAPFEEYEELSVDSVIEFARPYLNAQNLEAQDVSDGNINRVFRVIGKTSSVIVKQALPYLRVAGRAWPLTRHRIITEDLAYSIHNSLVPEIMPKIYGFDQEMSAITLEDLHSFQPWREALLLNHNSSHVPQVVARYCSEILIRTSDLVLSESDRQKIKEQFYYTELCLVTEELFFTAPYMENKSNRYESGLESLVQDLQADDILRAAASEMRTIFKTKDQALIHGDFHSGSVMVSTDQVRIIDLEFAFYGPFGFDLGVLFANLALSRISHEMLGDVSYCLSIDTYARKIWDFFIEDLNSLASEYSFDVSQFRNNMEHDMYRFAGMEMIRRIIGLAHAKEIDSLPDSVRLKGQIKAVQAGRALIVDSFGFDFEQFWITATREVNHA